MSRLQTLNSLILYDPEHSFYIYRLCCDWIVVTEVHRASVTGRRHLCVQLKSSRQRKEALAGLRARRVRTVPEWPLKEYSDEPWAGPGTKTNLHQARTKPAGLLAPILLDRPWEPNQRAIPQTDQLIASGHPPCSGLSQWSPKARLFSHSLPPSTPSTCTAPHRTSHPDLVPFHITDRCSDPTVTSPHPRRSWTTSLRVHLFQPYRHRLPAATSHGHCFLPMVHHETHRRPCLRPPPSRFLETRPTDDH